MNNAGVNTNPLLWFVCRYCKRAFRQPGDLIQHKKENHTRWYFRDKKLKQQGSSRAETSAPAQGSLTRTEGASSSSSLCSASILLECPVGSADSSHSGRASNPPQGTNPVEAPRAENRAAETSVGVYDKRPSARTTASNRLSFNAIPGSPTRLVVTSTTVPLAHPFSVPIESQINPEIVQTPGIPSAKPMDMELTAKEDAKSVQALSNGSHSEIRIEIKEKQQQMDTAEVGIKPKTLTEPLVAISLPAEISLENLKDPPPACPIIPEAAMEEISVPTGMCAAILEAASEQIVHRSRECPTLSEEALEEISPPKQTCQMSPEASSEEISPPRLTCQMTPEASSVEISPPRQTCQMTPEASSEEISPPGQTCQMTPEASSEEVSPPRQTWQMTPEASSEEVSGPPLLVPQSNNVHLRSRVEGLKVFITSASANFDIDGVLRNEYQSGTPVAHSKIDPYTVRKPSSFCCTYCPRAFKTRGASKLHEISHGRSRFKCLYCSLWFTHPRTRISHVKKEHQIETSRRNDNAQSLENGIEKKLETDGLEYQRIFGDARPSTVTQRKRRLAPRPRRTYFCDKCDLEFPIASKYLAHKRSHVSKIPLKYFTKVCRSTFRPRQYHDQDRPVGLLERRERPYRCSVCSMVFTHAGTLKLHMEIHSPVRPYCPLCFGRFETTRQVWLHLGEVHGKFSQSKFKEPPEMTTAVVAKKPIGPRRQRDSVSHLKLTKLSKTSVEGL